MLFLARGGHMSNAQVSQSQTPPPAKYQIVQNNGTIIQPEDQLINGDVSPCELAHHNNNKTEEEALPDKEEAPSQLIARVRRNEKDLARCEQMSKLAGDSLHHHNHRRPSRTSCPSPYYFGGGIPSHDYLTSNKTYYSIKDDAETPGRDSTATSKSSRSSIDILFGKVDSLRKSCFLSKENEESIPLPFKPEKKIQKIQSKSKLGKSLSGVHIRVGRFLWLPVKKIFTHLSSEKGVIGKEISDPFDQFRRKVRAQNMHSYSEKQSDSAHAAQISHGDERNVLFSWAEKWRPKRLTDFICNTQQAQDLLLLVSQKRCPNIIFEGPPGVGKNSLIRAMIAEIYQNVEPIRQRKLIIELKGERVNKISVPINTTSNHKEINLSSLRGYERNVIDILVKSDLRSNTSEHDVDYTVIVICEADKLSTDTQNYISWLMERHQDSCKLIFCCSNISKLEPLISLCKVVNVQPPTNEQMIQVLMHIAKQERISLPRAFAKRIAESSEENLRQAIRSLEACKRSQYPFTEDQKILTGWEDVIAKIAKSIVEEQSPKQLYNIRAKLQQLIIHNLCPNFVFSTLVEELKQHLDDNLQSILDDLYAAYNGNMNNEVEDPSTGNRGQSFAVDAAKRNANHYIQIEEFTARFMSVYKAADKKNSE